MHFQTTTNENTFHMHYAQNSRNQLSSTPPSAVSTPLSRSSASRGLLFLSLLVNNIRFDGLGEVHISLLSSLDRAWQLKIQMITLLK
jgi:hypothetical protein